MSDNRRDDRPQEQPNGGRSVPTDRKSPVGAPVIRGDESVAGTRARDAVQFDPDDPESLTEAAATVRQFATGTNSGDHLDMLRGAAACAALVRGEGSYKAAAERASRLPAGQTSSDEDPGSNSDTDTASVSVSFIRKWARVHDLPRSVRRQVALGTIAPTAAKHIARVAGEARLLLAWATLDGNLTVREVRSVASTVNDGVPIERALTQYDVRLGELEIALPPTVYRDLRQQAALDGVNPGEIVAEALESHLE